MNEFIEGTFEHMSETFREPLRARALWMFMNKESEINLATGENLKEHEGFSMLLLKEFENNKRPYAAAGYILATMQERERDKESLWSKMYFNTQRLDAINL